MTGYQSKRAAAQDKLVQEPVAYLCKPDQHGLFDRPTPDKACEDCFPVYAAPPQPAQLREENERLHVENRRLIDRIETIGVPVGVGGFATTTSAQPAQRTWVGLTDEER